MEQTVMSPEFVSREAHLAEATSSNNNNKTPAPAAGEITNTIKTTASRLNELDIRDSLAESLVLPRASLFVRPPTPPPKDPPKSIAASSRPGTSRTVASNDTAIPRSVFNKAVDVDLRQSTATSGEIKIAAALSVLQSARALGKPAKGATKNNNNNNNNNNSTAFTTMHPLAMSPPSPLAPSVARMPRRPARPASLRLSSLSSRTGLTTDKIVVVNSSRPATSESQSSQPHTGVTDTTRGFRTKYGRGKYATTELVPRPSDDGEDPLNWPTWRKELNFYALLMNVAMVNVMKTALVSVNDVLSSQLSSSYVAAVALTGVPLMLSAGTGVAAITVSKLWGRRPVYLVSMLLVFIGLVWNSQVSTAYGQFMAARIFQGLGWGAFETLMPGTILDTYFEHERPKKMGIYRIVTAATLWGAPLLGGLTSQHPHGPVLQFRILAVFQAVSIPLLVFGAAETMYDRQSATGEKTTPGWSPRTGWSSLGLKSSSRHGRLPAWARGRGFTVDRVIQYAKSVARPQSYFAPGTQGITAVDTALLKQPLRALAAPTTLLVFLASFLPHSLLWGFSFALSGLFARAPFQLVPATVGSLLATTLVFSTLVAAVLSFGRPWASTLAAFASPATHLFVLGVGTLLSFVGLLAFGLYVGAHEGNPAVPVADANDTPDFRFSALSFVLGLVAAGAYTLKTPTAPMIVRSTQFTSPNLVVSLRNFADMEAGVAFWRTLFAGIFVMAIPAATVAHASALKSTGIGVAVVQVFVVVGLGFVWSRFQEDVWRLDGRILRSTDLGAVKMATSYFELDE